MRVATRSADGSLIGDQAGERDLDWHYEVRWYPPTPVNAEQGVAPAVRDLETE